MPARIANQSQLHHRQIEVEGASIHAVAGGSAEQPTVLFLHGWPESWAMFKQIMLSLSTETHVAAIDLPGVGASEMPPTAHDKHTLARYIHGVFTHTSFDYFYDQLAGSAGVSRASRDTYAQAYAGPEALHTGFEWYRAFAQDEQANRNSASDPVQTPVLYVRGEQEAGDLERYLNGLRSGGLRNVQGRVVPGSGHFLVDEQPEAPLALLRAFMERSA